MTLWGEVRGVSSVFLFFTGRSILFSRPEVVMQIYIGGSIIHEKENS
ncbi:hypothetical protein [Paenibacillus amylolyticus]|nr:hypothetical protein [Paenibacillus amylolyticus]